MKLYEVRKIEASSGKILFSTNATELGLVRLSARIANKGTSDGDSTLGQELEIVMASELSVQDPFSSDVRWETRCLGSDFKYCSGLLFPTPAQMAKYMKSG